MTIALCQTPCPNFLAKCACLSPRVGMPRWVKCLAIWQTSGFPFHPRAGTSRKPCGQYPSRRKIDFTSEIGMDRQQSRHAGLCDSYVGRHSVRWQSHSSLNPAERDYVILTTALMAKVKTPMLRFNPAERDGERMNEEG